MNEKNEQLSLSKEAVGLWRQATDVAGLCKEIVVKTALDIQGRKYVKVEGWMAIAVAHGFVASIKSVDFRPDGVLAVAELRRLSDSMVITTAEGFVGADEPVWFGGKDTIWKQGQEKEIMRPKRANYAIRAMAQTRAISRVCRSVFAHVVFLIDADLATVPAEEVATDAEVIDIGAVGHAGKVEEEKEKHREKAGTDQTKSEPQKTGGAKTEDKKTTEVPRDVDPKLVEQFRDRKWEKVRIHFGTNGPKNFPPAGKSLGELEEKQLRWYVDEWQPKPYGNKPLGEDDVLLRAALDAAKDEAFKQ